MIRVGPRRIMNMAAGTPTEAAAFAPSDISGLYLWLDASDATTITLSGSDVTAWSDKSTGGNSLVSDGNPPALLTADQNGLNGIDFDGTERLIDTTPNSNLSGQNQLAIFAIANNTSSTTSRSLISIWNDSESAACWSLGKRNVTEEVHWLISLLGTDSNARQAGNMGTAGVAHFIGGDYSRSSIVSQLDVYDNDTVGENATADSPLHNSAAALCIGGVEDNSTYGLANFIGTVYEIVVYNALITGTDFTNLKSYLINKWGVSV